MPPEASVSCGMSEPTVIALACLAVIAFGMLCQTSLNMAIILTAFDGMLESWSGAHREPAAPAPRGSGRLIARARRLQRAYRHLDDALRLPQHDLRHQEQGQGPAARRPHGQHGRLKRTLLRAPAGAPRPPRPAPAALR